MTGRLKDEWTRHRSAGWALFDQALVSGVNFTNGILLARTLGPDRYGRFVLETLIILFVQGMFMGFVTGPMMVIATEHTGESLRKYTSEVFGLALLTSIVCVAGAVTAHTFIPGTGHGSSAAAFGAAALAFILQDFVRRYRFATASPRTSFALDAVAYLGFLGAIAVMALTGTEITVPRVFLAQAGAFLLALAVPGALPRKVVPKLQAESVRRHWKEGRWLTGSQILNWSSFNLITVGAGWIGGAAAAGMLKIAQNVAGLLNPVFQAIENIVPTEASRRLLAHGNAGLRIYIRNALLLIAAVYTVLLGVIALFRTEIVGIVYGTKYLGAASLILWFSFGMLMLSLSNVTNAGLRAANSSRGVFAGLLASTACVLGLGYWAYLRYGLDGAGAIFLLASVAQLGVTSVYFRSVSRDG